MVQIFCAVVGERASAFAVRVDERDTVFDLKKAIHGELRCDATARELQLFLAKKDGAWLIGEQIQDIQDGDGLSPLQVVQRTLRSVGLSDADVNRMADDEEAAAKGPVHVLVVVPTIVVQERAQKKAKLSTSHFTHKDMMAIASSLDIDAWGVGGVSLDLRFVEPDFPTWIYARQEMLDLFKIFKAEEQAMVFVGSPGVGKSMLVVLLAFYKALHQNKRVVLFRRLKQAGCSMLYLDAGSRSYWRSKTARIDDVWALLDEDVELCLDGFTYDDIRPHIDKLGGFRLLATNARYPVKDGDIEVLCHCLLPSWSLLDLSAIGAHLHWTDLEIKNKYFYSGGNLRYFLATTAFIKDSMDQVLYGVDSQVTTALDSFHHGWPIQLTGPLWMAGVNVQSGSATIGNERRDLQKYVDFNDWVSVLACEFALRRVGKTLLRPYCKHLWTKGQLLGDDKLMDLAFENYVHALVKDGETIKLQVRPYDPTNAGEATYTALEFQAKSCRNDGVDAAECEQAMQEFACSDVDYWYPASRSLMNMDSVAKLKMDCQDVIGLIEITKHKHHSIDSDALAKYAALFPGVSCRFIVLVPDKLSCDEVQLNLGSSPTPVPLFVAYLPTWKG